jgi:hypothetical protein
VYRLRLLALLVQTRTHTDTSGAGAAGAVEFLNTQFTCFAFAKIINTDTSGPGTPGTVVGIVNTQFTCFTGTKSHTLTLQELVLRSSGGNSSSRTSWARRAHRYSVYLLYEYQSSSTDLRSCCRGSSSLRRAYSVYLLY